MRLLGPVLLALLAACGEEAGESSPETPRTPKDPDVIARVKILRAQQEVRKLETEILQYQTLRKEWPDDLGALGWSRLDPWGNEYDFFVEEGRPVAFSYGPDGEYDTADDVYDEE